MRNICVIAGLGLAQLAVPWPLTVAEPQEAWHFPQTDSCRFPVSGSAIGTSSSPTCSRYATGFIQFDEYHLILRLTGREIVDCAEIRIFVRGAEGVGPVSFPTQLPRPPLQLSLNVYSAETLVATGETQSTGQAGYLKVTAHWSTPSEANQIRLLFSLSSAYDLLVPGWVVESSEEAPFVVVTRMEC